MIDGSNYFLPKGVPGSNSSMPEMIAGVERVLCEMGDARIWRVRSVAAGGVISLAWQDDESYQINLAPRDADPHGLLVKTREIDGLFETKMFLYAAKGLLRTHHDFFPLEEFRDKEFNIVNTINASLIGVPIAKGIGDDEQIEFFETLFLPITNLMQ